MCVVLSENEKEKKNKDESDRPNREERIVRYVVGEDGLGEARVGLKKSDFLSFFFFSFFFFIGLGCYIFPIPFAHKDL